ncbi:ligand-binding sensor domain-containing protein [Niastella caeni]|nr:two-component regulator propeller domain-containing protein [Niastella caeni]
MKDFSITNYNSDNLLPQNSIKSMTFDKNGFLWMATEMGIVRFDGRYAKYYNTDNTSALHTNRCDLVKTTGAACKLIIEPEFGSHILLTPTHDYQLAYDSSLSGDTLQSNLWNNQLFHFKRLYKQQAHAGKYQALLNDLDKNKQIVTVNEKQAYVKKGSELYFMDENTGQIQRLAHMNNLRCRLMFSVDSLFFYIDEANKVHAFKNGLLQPNIVASQKLNQLLQQPGAIDKTEFVLRDSRHTFLQGKGSIMMLVVENNQLHYHTIVSNIPNKDISCIIYNEPGKILYLGTTTNGLYILKKHDFKVLTFDNTRADINCLYAQVELDNGKILTSSGILTNDKKNNRAFSKPFDNYAILKAHDGWLWYSSNHWLMRSDPTFQINTRVKNIGELLTGILETDKKEIIYSTLSQVIMLSGNEEIVLVAHSGLLKGAVISALGYLGKNIIWIGTNKGLYRYNITNRTLMKENELSNANVRMIYTARDSSIWIGTYHDGFYKYHKQHFIRMPQDAQNRLSGVHTFMEDKKGYFWIATNKGLFTVNKKELDNVSNGQKDAVFYYYIDKSSGFRTNEFNGGCTPCGIVTENRLFSLPSMDGLVQFNPDSVYLAPIDKPVFVDYITVNSKPVQPDTILRIAPPFQQMAIGFSSPYFGNPANLHLEYSIPEVDKQWYRLADDHTLVLTGLAKGAYTLLVRKQVNYRQYIYKTIHFTIIPRWHETTLFRLLAVFLGIGLLVTYFLTRYDRQRKRSIYLEQKVFERTHELSLTVKELERSNESLNITKQNLSESNRVKEKMLSIILHDLRSPLKFLHMLATRLEQDHSTITPEEHSPLLSQFRQATSDLYVFIQDFLVWTNSQKQGVMIKKETIVLRETVNDILSLYKVGSQIKNNIITNNVPEHIRITTDVNILKLIIRNLIDNANKYCTNGKIMIDVLETGTHLSLTISDTGRKMERSLMEKILNNAYTQTDISHGFGFKVINELLVKIDGRLQIDLTDAEPGNRISILFKKESL